MPHGTFEQARYYLGPDFISPEELMYHENKDFAAHFKYSDEQLAHLAKTVPSVYLLLLAQKEDYIIAPGPSSDMNLNGVRLLDYEMISRMCWERFQGQLFIDEDKVTAAEWLLICKKPKRVLMEKSGDIKKDDCLSLLYIPNVTQISYAFCVFEILRGRPASDYFQAETSSKTNYGDQLRFGVNGCESFDIAITQRADLNNFAHFSQAMRQI